METNALHHGLRFDLPPGWEQLDRDRLRAPAVADEVPTLEITASPLPRRADVAGFARERLELLESSLPGLRVLRANRHDDRPLPRHDYLLDASRFDVRRPLRRVVYVVHHGTGYSLSIGLTRRSSKVLRRSIDRLVAALAPTD